MKILSVVSSGQNHLLKQSPPADGFISLKAKENWNPALQICGTTLPAGITAPDGDNLSPSRRARHAVAVASRQPATATEPLAHALVSTISLVSLFFLLNFFYCYLYLFNYLFLFSLMFNLLILIFSSSCILSYLVDC